MPSPSSRSVRIFLSSTFRDFGEERDLLVRHVFPELRARLRERFVEIVDVDLRWGITAEQAERGEVLPICLAEIDRARPYFVGILGERYGWIPSAEAFAQDLLERHAWLHDHVGTKSVTELEILHGVLNNPALAGRALFYFRLADYSVAKGGDYVPNLEDDRIRQRHLKNTIRESGFPVVEDYPTPEAFAKKLKDDLWTILDQAFPADRVPDAFEREGRRHEAYAIPRRRLYLGGEAYSQALTKYLENNQQRILIEGQSGGGKSALIANWLQSYADSHPDIVVFEHYTAASGDAADSVLLVKRLIEHIKRSTRSDDELPEDPERLLESLPLWLTKASVWGSEKGLRWVFTIDALNGLRDRRDLGWFPELIPERVYFVFSSLPSDVMEALLTKGDWQRILINPLTNKECTHLLTTYLARYNKTLTNDLTEQVLRHPLSSNPLFLRTLAEEMRVFGVHEQLEKQLYHYLDSQTVDDLFERVLERIENDCGRSAVQASLEAIWASRAGIEEQEILKFCNLAPIEWATIRAALDDVLLESAGRITFAHDYLKIAISDRYLKGNNTLDNESQSDQAKKLRQNLHARIADWFEKQFLNDIVKKQQQITTWSTTNSKPIHNQSQLIETISVARVAEEIPYQWKQASNWQNLLKCLTDQKIFNAIFDNRPKNEIAYYWFDLRKSLKIDITKKFREAVSKWEKNSEFLEFVQSLNKVVEFQIYNGVFDEFFEKMIEHYIRIIAKTENITEYYKLSLSLGEFYRAKANYQKSIVLYLNILKNKQFNFEWLSQINRQLAQTYCALGNFQLASKCFRRSINLFERSNLIINSYLVDLKRDYFWNTYVQGKLEFSIKNLLNLYRSYKEKYSADNVILGNIANNLAVMLYFCGDLNQATKYFMIASKDLNTHINEDHYGNAIGILNYAWLKEAHGDIFSARKDYFIAKKIIEKQFGHLHPTAAIIHGSIAWNYRISENYYRSEKYFKSAILISIKILGKSHVDCVDHYSGLGLLYLAQKKFDESILFLLKSLKILKDKFSENHVRTRVIFCYLSEYYFNRNDRKKAIFYSIKSLENLKFKKISTSIDYAVVMNSFAISLFINGNYNEAFTIQKAICRMFKKKYGEEHPDTYIVQKNLALMKIRISELQLVTRRLSFDTALKSAILAKYSPKVKNKFYNSEFSRLLLTRRYLGSSTM